jgi:hypothetical protein
MNRSNLEYLVIDARVVCEGGWRLAPYRRSPGAAVCITIWTVEYPAGVCKEPVGRYVMSRVCS